MEIYLIRHTRTILNDDICYGQSDVPLKEPYLEEFVKIAGQITTDDAVIYSSPLQRCAILASYLSINNQKCRTVIFDERLKEMSFGNWTLKSWNDIEYDSLKNWSSDFVNNPVPGGESFTQLSNRVNDFIDNTLLKQNPLKTSILVTHAGVIMSILCRINGISLEDAFKMKVSYGRVFRLRIEGNIIS